MNNRHEDKQLIDDLARGEDAALFSNLGSRLRDLRRQSGLSLVQLSERCDTSVAMLSYIERGQAQPSLKTLHRIRGAFGVPMSALFPDEDIPARRSVVQRASTRKTADFMSQGLIKHRLSPHDDSDLELLLLEFGPGGNSGEKPWLRIGEKAGFVLLGTIRLVVGDETFDLDEGDSFQFDASAPHKLSNLGIGPAKVIWVIKSDVAVRQLGG